MSVWNIIFILFCIYQLNAERILYGFKNLQTNLSEIVSMRASFEGYSRSKLECSRTCSDHHDCISFLFNKVTRECRILNTEDLEEKPKILQNIDSNDWVYYTTQKGCSPVFCKTERGFVFDSKLCFCFKYISEDPLTSIQAKLDCISRQPNAYLVKIDREPKQKVIKEYLDKINETKYKFAWIQGERSPGGDWLYTDKKKMQYFMFDWKIDKESGRKDTDQNMAISLEDKTWYALRSNKTFPFICEILKPANYISEL